LIPGFSAAVKLAKGVRARAQIEARIGELNDLCSTPAVSHYEGTRRFEVVTAICDAKLGVAISEGINGWMLRVIMGDYLDVMEREYAMIRNQAAGVPATKAETYALGLAVKEVSLSLEELGEQLAELRAELTRRLRALKLAIVLVALLTCSVAVIASRLLTP
jgi:hypothetical protein